MAFRAAQPHGEAHEVFPDVFFVTGAFKASPGVSIPRNMVIVRQGAELSIINSVRLTPEGERKLDALGKVKHLVRMGHNHGTDDPYYVDRYKPTVWAPAGIKHRGSFATDRELRPGECPIADGQVFVFTGGKIAEAALVLAREGGIMISCDAFQNWTTFEGASTFGKLTLKLMKFGPNMIGPIWAKQIGPGARGQFDALLAMDWKHALSGHGTPLRDTAKEGLREALKRQYGA